jgi:hypothetical protein
MVCIKTLFWYLPGRIEENHKNVRISGLRNIQVLLAVCMFEKCDFILMGSTNLD